MTFRQGTRWLLPHRQLRSAILCASIAHWRQETTFTTLPYMTSGQCQISLPMFTQASVRYVWAEHLRLSPVVILVRTNHLGIMGVAVLIANTHSQRRPSLGGAKAPKFQQRKR